MYQTKKRRWIKITAIFTAAVCVCGAVALFGANAAVTASAEDKILTRQQAAQIEADCILVLGCGVREDGTPSSMLLDRINEGVALFQSGASDRLLMSGDHGREDYNEVGTMKQVAIDAGVPSDQVFMDHAGFSTYESMYRARDIFQAKKIIIVTQRYHLYRAIYLAEQLGLEAYGVPSDPREYAGQQSRDIREFFARSKDFVYAMFQPLPTYLGEAIPVAGNGDLTND